MGQARGIPRRHAVSREREYHGAGPWHPKKTCPPACRFPKLLKPFPIDFTSRQRVVSTTQKQTNSHRLIQAGANMRLRPIIGWVVFVSLIGIISQVVPSVTGSYYFVKGNRLYSNGDYKGAVAAYEHSVSSDPKFARGYVELGSAYRELEDYAQAEKAFAKAVSIQEDSCAQCGLGMVYHLQHRYSEAEVALNRAITLNPADECAFHHLGWL